MALTAFLGSGLAPGPLGPHALRGALILQGTLLEERTMVSGKQKQQNIHCKSGDFKRTSGLFLNAIGLIPGISKTSGKLYT